jgi:hypothetical protein
MNKMDPKEAMAPSRLSRSAAHNRNWLTRTVSLLSHRKMITWRLAISNGEAPEFELKHPSVFHPDGLGFSRCGRWLATANHGGGSVSVFQRRSSILSSGKLSYGPEPVTVIQDRQFRYPHSVTFTPRTNHLIVTSAGANYFTVYEPRPHYFGMQWSQSPVAPPVRFDMAEQDMSVGWHQLEVDPKYGSFRGRCFDKDVGRTRARTRQELDDC